MSNLTLDTSRFTNAHKKAPSGQGMWFFTFTVDGSPVQKFTNDTWKNAKKWAMTEAKNLDASAVRVDP